MKVIWDLDAMVDRDNIFSYIEQDDFAAAIRMDDEIEAQGHGLAEFPEMGRLGRIAGTREWVVAKTPYVLIYETNSERVNIVRVLHGAQDWPPTL